jgi:tellurite resistance protein TerC
MIWAWVGFLLFIFLMQAIDLGILHRKRHVIGMKEALVWFGVWMGLALLFNLGLIAIHPRGLEAGLEFFTAFLVEKSLSIDNVFVFILIFNYFQIAPANQHKVLSLGILGAIVLRIVFIVGGLAIIERFQWTLYLFGAFLLFTGIMLLVRKQEEYDPGSSWGIRMIKRFVPLTDRNENGRFWIRREGRFWATPLFAALVAIESADILFAADSIPATFAITTDPFVVFTANIFAMLGLRALYFAVQGFMKMFHFLHVGFALIILILGLKMVLHDIYTLPIAFSLLMVVFILLICVILSLLRPRKADLKQLFERTEQLGLIPFRRLLLIENIVDMGDMNVRDCMRPRSDVRTIRLDHDWQANFNTIGTSQFSRYPVLEREGGNPIGVVHAKNVLLDCHNPSTNSDRFRILSRPVMQFAEELSLEEAMSRFQRRFDRMAMVVNDQGQWTGILTFEDVVQEIVGNMGDEFDETRGGDMVSLVDSLPPDRVFLDLEATSIEAATQEIIARIPADQLPLPADTVLKLLLRRKPVKTVYLGDGICVLHSRYTGSGPPVMAFARCDTGVPLDSSDALAELFFVLLTPGHKPRLQSRLLTNIDGLFKSQYVSERLRKAKTPESVIEAIQAGQQVPID